MSIKNYFITAAVGLASLQANAQLSKNPDKFLGNITTSGQVDYGKEKYYTLWNQITPENESKWSSVQGSSQTSWNWGGVDNCVNYAKNHNFPFKFHTFVWGSQFPSWVKNLSLPNRYNAIVNWVDGVKKKYAKLAMIDVVNEAIDGHQPDTHYIKDALGGGGKTGYDWLIKAFEMAYERYPNSILIYNDFNTFQWNTDQFITLVQAIRDGGAPIDAYGCQSHDLTDCDLSKLKSSEQKIHNALKMPMYITEYDIGTRNDALQEQRYKEQIPYLWGLEHCAGITLWGYIYGNTWIEEKDAQGNVIARGISGLIKDGKDRPAMTWLRDWMKTEDALTAKSPYPGMKKRVGVYIKTRDFKMAKGDVTPVKVRTVITDDAKAENPDIAIEKVELYDGTSLIAEMTEEPYVTNYTPAASGTRTLKAIVYTNDGKQYERQSRISVQSGTTKREPYNGEPIELPGTINTGEYDKGLSGVTYNKGVGRNATTATQADGWMEYTVDVKEAGLYQFDAEVAAASNGGALHISEYGLDDLTYYSNIVEVPSTGSKTNFQKLHGVFIKELTAGRHILCLNTDKGGYYIKSLTIYPYAEDKTMTCTVSKNKSTLEVGDVTTISVTASSKTSTVARVDVYASGLCIATMKEEPYTFDYVPVAYGTQAITAVVTDAEGKSKSSTASTLTVKPKREPYNDVIAIPGTLEAENYDKAGEGYSYHDTSTKNEGDASFRTAEGVDIVNGNGGKAIGYTEADEWMEYTVNVAEAGKYTCEAVVSSGVTGSKFTVQRKNSSSTTTLFTLEVPQTASNNWNTYKKIAVPTSTTNPAPKAIQLPKGEYVLRITIKGKQCNIDKLIFKSVSTGIDDVKSDELTGASYNLSGQKVDNGYRGIVIRNGKKILRK